MPPKADLSRFLDVAADYFRGFDYAPDTIREMIMYQGGLPLQDREDWYPDSGHRAADVFSMVMSRLHHPKTGTGVVAGAAAAATATQPPTGHIAPRAPPPPAPAPKAVKPLPQQRQQQQQARAQPPNLPAQKMAVPRVTTQAAARPQIRRINTAMAFTPETTASEFPSATYEHELDDGADEYDGTRTPFDVFFGQRPPDETWDRIARGFSLGNRMASNFFREAALLGSLDQLGADHEGSNEAYLNTHEPFCLVAVGVQGGGKSHTSACIVESCLLPLQTVDPATLRRQDVVRLEQPMAALVLHYDSCDATVCEATGIISPAAYLERLHESALRQGHSVSLRKEKMVVLVSPTYYLQRQKFYGSYCVVKPLLFRWSTLTADHLKRIMALPEGNPQPLYVSAMMDLLRRYQAQGVMPTFQSFVVEVTAMCNIPGQGGALKQRLSLLESLVAESPKNERLRGLGADLLSSVSQGVLVIADMTDPLLNTGEVNGIFQMLVEQFRALPLSGGGGKLLALDEAHKFMDGTSTDGLSAAIVNVARLMRHDGIRLVVSTQSPKTLAPELLELVTVAVLHRFHSGDWFAHLEKKTAPAGRRPRRRHGARPGTRADLCEPAQPTRAGGPCRPAPPGRRPALGSRKFARRQWGRRARRR